MPGRVRICLLKPDGTPVVAQYKTKLQLLAGIARVLPNLALRRDRLAQLDAMRRDIEKKNAAAMRANKGRVVKAAAESAAQTGGAAAKKKK